MLVHLAFVKLESDDDSAADLAQALREGLAAWSVHVMVPADVEARAAWDAALEIRGDSVDIGAAQRALDETLRAWKVAASKGWTFARAVDS